MPSRYLLSLALCVGAAVTLPAQSGKTVYISVDMEGISGISGDDQLSPGGAELHQRATAQRSHSGRRAMQM